MEKPNNHISILNLNVVLMAIKNPQRDFHLSNFETALNDKDIFKKIRFNPCDTSLLFVKKSFSVVIKSLIFYNPNLKL